MSMPSKWEIAQFWEQGRNRDEFAPHLSLVEPCCFACGWFSECWEEKTPRARWRRARLERAHIVPRSLGGPDTADNLLLLCRPCHEDSPDWADPRQMARWIATRAERPSKEVETSRHGLPLPVRHQSSGMPLPLSPRSRTRKSE
ncbi:HNH endonuclease [Streptomyces lydicamycinicus]|uniref:HNH endonuclease n=1 Tax=Streptomyces lydicamycinicus TaxID=1546107 RepID=UPI003C2C4808